MALPPISDKSITGVSFVQRTEPETKTDKAAQSPQQLQERLSQYGVGITQASTKISFQASIVSHVFSDQGQAVENSLKMTYQAAITKLNEILAPQVGEDTPISDDNLKAQGADYWTPENTSKRILDGATGFLAGFQRANPDLEGQALMDRFNEVVGGGLRQGFEEAQTILKDLKVFDGAVKDNFDSTFSLVQAGLTDFRNNYLGLGDNAMPETAPTVTGTTESETSNVEANDAETGESETNPSRA